MPKTRNSPLKAVLFTDVVGSTELARELGDERWARLLAAQRRIVRDQLRANRGREVDTAGDGFFAVFEGPADAVRCAFVAIRKVQDLRSELERLRREAEDAERRYDLSRAAELARRV